MLSVVCLGLLLVSFWNVGVRSAPPLSHLGEGLVWKCDDVSPKGTSSGNEGLRRDTWNRKYSGSSSSAGLAEGDFNVEDGSTFFASLKSRETEVEVAEGEGGRVPATNVRRERMVFTTAKKDSLNEDEGVRAESGEDRSEEFGDLDSDIASFDARSQSSENGVEKGEGADEKKAGEMAGLGVYEKALDSYLVESEAERKKRLEKAVETYVEEYIEKHLGEELIKNPGVAKKTVFEFVPKNGAKIRTITTTVAKTIGRNEELKKKKKKEAFSPVKGGKTTAAQAKRKYRKPFRKSGTRQQGPSRKWTVIVH